MKIKHMSKQELYKFCEEKTFQNILTWRRPELLRILNGELATVVIPESNQRVKLVRDGVLQTYYARAGKRVRLTDKAKRVLTEDK